MRVIWYPMTSSNFPNDFDQVNTVLCKLLHAYSTSNDLLDINMQVVENPNALAVPTSMVKPILQTQNPVHIM